MPDTKISALTDGVTADATDRIPAARAGANVYVTPAYIRSYLLAQANTWTAAQTLTQGTITANAPQIDGTVTWNNAGVDFFGWQLNVTKTAAGSGSRLLNLMVGGTSRFSIYPDTGVSATSGVGIGNPVSGGVRLTAAAAALYVLDNVGTSYAAVYASTVGLAGDAFLTRDAAEVVAARNGTTAQSFRVYSTWTNASNYERGALNAGADFIELAAETAGTGDDNLDVRLTPAGTGNVRFGTHAAIAAETVTGYVTIKDAGGTSRKIAVVS